MSTGRRRQLLQGSPGLNGIDFVEAGAPAGGPLPTTLTVTFVNPVAAGFPAPDQIEAVGENGRRIAVTDVQPVPADPLSAVVTLAGTGDFGPWTLRLVTGPTDPGPPAGIDPVLASASFRFAPQCLDTPCDRPPDPVAPPGPEPSLDYLAKDWEGFRRLLLDRLAIRQPGWTDRNPADVRTTLVEVIAHLADELSYRQDAVATEAYLGTARRRISVRRHVRLVDYRMSDGTNARTWVQIAPAAGEPAFPPGQVMVPKGTRFLTAGPDDPAVITANTPEEVRARAAGADEFAAMSPLAVVTAAHNAMRFHTWAGARPVLPAGATSATLQGALPELAKGMVLLLVENRDPVAGRHTREDADPSRRHPVRLTAAAVATDPLTTEPITEIRWDPGDALPWPLVTLVEIEGVEHDDAALALGNLVLVDHGTAHPPLALPPVLPGRVYRPSLPHGPITQVPLQLVTVRTPDGSGTREVLERYPESGPATRAIGVAPAAVRPDLVLTDGGAPWTVQSDLLTSGSEKHFVVEVDDEQTAWLRFGREYGRLPDAGQAPKDGVALTATYRTGNGTAGNVGRGAIRQLLDDGTAPAELVAALARGTVSNPVPASGGTDPQTIEEVRQQAPFTFRRQLRAVTADDYARRAEQFGEPGPREVQRALATIRWTGSWYTVTVSVDRFGGAELDDDFQARLVSYLNRYRMAGHDLAVRRATYVPLEVGLRIRVRDDHRRDLVRAELLQVLSDQRLPDGRLGLFHPDRLTFGQDVYLGPIVAAAQAVPGVAHVVEVTRFARYRQAGTDARRSGRLDLAGHEVARLDNDPSRPDRGILRIDELVGGR